MSQEETFPVHETIKVLQGKTIRKNEKWWSAALLIESYGRKQVALYLWNKNTDGVWKRKQKFTVPSKDIWEALKEAVDNHVMSI